MTIRSARMIRWCAFLAAAFLIAGCVPAEAEPGEPERLPWGMSFGSDGPEGDGADLFTGTPIRMSFEDDSLSMRADCNTMFAPVKLDDGTITLEADAFASTLVGCDDAGRARDTWLTDFVSAGPRWKLRDDRLTLTGPTATLVLHQE